jgi:hypothetical protein
LSGLKVQKECMIFRNELNDGVFLGGNEVRDFRGDITLFAFDRQAFPFQKHVQTHLVCGKKESMALSPGAAGSHDEHIRFYGGVVKASNKYRMWYIGNYGNRIDSYGIKLGGYEGKVICYAESENGYDWVKPDLGLVEYKGSKHNNIIFLDEPDIMVAAAVLYEEDEKDASRRFKMIYEAKRNGKTCFCAAFSGDGVNWKRIAENPVGYSFEMTGIVKYNGFYYVNGQDISTAHYPFRARSLVTYVSKDFIHWTEYPALGFTRNDDLMGPSREWEWNTREEVHLGAGLWNRGGTLLGVYGQWHGTSYMDRRFVSIDLGLVLSHDGLFFYEPIKDFRILPAMEQEGSPPDFPALMQGQGMENIGDKTCYWYGLWRGNEGTGVRLAVWELDRFGMLKAYDNMDAGAISAGIRVTGTKNKKLYLNASNLNENSFLLIELLDDKYLPVKGCCGDMAAKIRENGFKIPVAWPGVNCINPEMGEVHVKIRFSGMRPEDCGFYALYIGE